MKKVLKLNEYIKFNNVLVGEISTINNKIDNVLDFEKYRVVLRHDAEGTPHFHFVILKDMVDLIISIKKMDIINGYSWDNFPVEHKLLLEWLDEESTNGKNMTNYINILMSWDVAHDTETIYDNIWMNKFLNRSK